MGIGWFTRDRWVHSGAPCGSLGSSGVIWFARVRPWGRWVHPGSLGSLVCAQGVVGFIRGHWVLSSLAGSLGSLRYDLGVVGFTRGRWVHSCALRG